jgi:AcrR family transcriptional regulator
MPRSPWGTSEKSEKRGYHHGRLKEALIEAARALVARHGPVGFTLAEAAKLVGVTAAAPYRHFTDRDELMSVVAKQGFENFRARLFAAWEDGKPDPAEALKRMGRAYLAFAREEPGYYFTMFGHAQKLQNNGGHVAAQQAFDALAQAAGAVLMSRGVPADGARQLAFEIWAMSHGVATLMLGRHLEPGGDECDPETILVGGVGAMIEKAIWMARKPEA